MIFLKQEAYDKDPELVISQNMKPLLDKLYENLRKPAGTTIKINNQDFIRLNEGRDSFSGEIIEDNDEFVTVKLLSNFQYYSTKEGKEPIALEDFLQLSKEERGKENILRISKEDIVEMKHDKDKETATHVVNFALTDLVGHAAKEEWSIATLEILDYFVGEILKVLDETGTHVIFTGDHGNIETIIDPLGRAHTGHTANMVGLHVRAPARDGREGYAMELETPEDSALTQTYPTMLQFLGLKVPAGKDQRSFLKDKDQKFYANPKTGRKQMVLAIFDGLGIPDPNDKRSPYNKADIPNIRKLFDLQQGGGRVNRLHAHGEFVGTRKPIGPTSAEMADWIEKKKPTQVHLQVENQYFANIYTTDVANAESLLREDSIEDKKKKNKELYAAYQAGEFKIVQADHTVVSKMLREEGSFYDGKQFRVSGFRKGHLLLLFDEGQVGGSEQGHRAMGTGSTDQELKMPITAIDSAIKDGSFFEEEGLNQDVIARIKEGRDAGYPFHVRAILQEEGVHASFLHLKAWIRLLHEYKVLSERVIIDPRVDGRDETKEMGWFYIQELRDYLRELGEDGKAYGRIGAIGPRNNLERDVTIFGRVEIEHNIQLTGRIPARVFLDMDERTYPIGAFTLERGRQLIRYLEAARFPIEVEQGIERLEELPGLLEELQSRADKLFDATWVQSPTKQEVEEAIEGLSDLGFAIKLAEEKDSLGDLIERVRGLETVRQTIKRDIPLFKEEAREVVRRFAESSVIILETDRDTEELPHLISA